MKKKYLLISESIYHFSESQSKELKKIWLSGTGISLIIGILISVIFFRFSSSPTEKQLQRQVDAYQMKFHILNNRINILMEGIKSLEEKDDKTYRVIYEMKRIPEDMRKAGIGGSVPYKDLFNSENTKIAGITMRNIDLAMRKMSVQASSFNEVEKAALAKEKMLSSLPTIMPVAKEKVRITSLFGWRKNPFNRNIRSFHSGVDFAGKPGTPIYATGNGIVEETGRMSGYGTVVVINHGYGYKTVYAHLSKAIVKPGEKVKRGQTIGKLGGSGATTGPHLHYEVIRNGQRVNPMNYILTTLSKDEFNAILDKAASD